MKIVPRKLQEEAASLPAAATVQAVTNGVTEYNRVHLEVAPDVTPADFLAVLSRLSGPKETIEQEIERRAAAIEARKLPEPWGSKAAEHIAEARYMLTRGGVFQPGQIRALLERAEFLEYQASAAPLADHGRKFPGRKPGSGGPIRKAIARLLKASPTMENPELWAAVASKPPKGWTAFDNSQGKYLEGPAASDGMNYRRFCNVCSEERGKLKV